MQHQHSTLLCQNFVPSKPTNPRIIIYITLRILFVLNLIHRSCAEKGIFHTIFHLETTGEQEFHIRAARTNSQPPSASHHIMIITRNENIFIYSCLCTAFHIAWLSVIRLTGMHVLNAARYSRPIHPQNTDAFNAVRKGSRSSRFS